MEQQSLSMREYLLQAARAAPSADNSQPWEFRLQDDRLTIGFDRQRCGDAVFGAESHPVYLAMGAIAENLVQAAGNLGVSLEWQYRDGDGEYLAVQLPDYKPEVPETQLDRQLFRRHTNRQAYRKQALSEEAREAVDAMTEAGARAHYFEGRDAAEICRLVGVASGLRFRLEEEVNWFADSLRVTPDAIAQGDGLDIHTLNLPPMGDRILPALANWKTLSRFNRFGAYRMMGQAEAKLLAQGSGVVAIYGDRGRQASLEAGRLMERLWIELNRQHLALHPFYVVRAMIDRCRSGLQADLQEAGGQFIKQYEASALGQAAGEQELQILFRVGVAKKPAVHSRRLPLKKLVRRERAAR